MKTLTAFCSVMIIAIAVWGQTKIGDVTLPSTFLTGEAALVLNGGGIREKMWWDLYVGGLYLKQKSKDYNNIIKANEPMAVKMHIISSVITSERMQEAINEGFGKSTKGNTAPIQDKINQLVSTFKDAIKIGDVFDLVYLPENGVNVYKNQKLAATIQGLDFKKALFGIWLSDDPVDSGLKNGMLGN